MKGISPLVSNPAGQIVAKDLTAYKDCAPVAMLQSTLTRIHDHRSSEESKDAPIAFPNDRTASIRSGEQNRHFRYHAILKRQNGHNDMQMTYQFPL